MYTQVMAVYGNASVQPMNGSIGSRGVPSNVSGTIPSGNTHLSTGMTQESA